MQEKWAEGEALPKPTAEQFNHIYDQCLFMFPELPPEQIRRKLERMGSHQLMLFGFYLVPAATPQERGLTD